MMHNIDIPNNWLNVALADIASEKIVYGIVQAGPHIESGVPYIKSSNVGGEIIVKDLQCTASEIHAKYKRSEVRPHDVIFSLRGNIGESSIVPTSLSEANLTQGTARIRVSSDYSNLYVRYQLNSTPIRNCIHRLSKGSTFKEISLEELRKFHIPVPPPHEQKKIAQILSTWDKAIATVEKLIANSSQKKKALMQQLLTGKKRFPGFDGEWKFLQFEGLFKVANEKKTQVKSSNYLNVGKTPIVDQGKQLISGYTNNSTIYQDIPVIIFGDHTRIIKWIDFIFSTGADGTQIIKNQPNLDMKFGYYLLANTELPNLGYSRHMRELKEKDFKYPVDIEEQKKIASVLSSADREIETWQQELEYLKQEKKALMQQLLTGKRRVVIDA